jgi:dihydrofolate synthase/folylpolyglutamate synthase
VRLIEAGLLALGASTVAFTSPHVQSLAERWRIDGRLARAEELLPLAREVARMEVTSGIGLSWFERTAAMAVLLAAARPGCHLLWEVGLGGRLDCANALDCRMAVLTHLSHDHRDVLGPTLRHIAAEKLPISRRGRPLIIAPQSPEAQAAIQANLPEGVPCTWAQAEAVRVPLSLAGVHQAGNAATALAAIRLLMPGCDEMLVWQGMAKAQLAARCQLLPQAGRQLLIDGAHNGPSIAATVAVAQASLRPHWILVVGLARDKEVDEVVDVLPKGITMVRCGYQSPRARDHECWPAVLLQTRWFDDITAVLAFFPDHDLCITGSFYLAGEALVAISAPVIPG